MTAPVDVLAVMDENAALLDVMANGYSANPEHRAAAERAHEARAAVAELMEQQQRDAQLVAVLLSYLNDSLSVHDKSRLVTELANRGLADHNDTRRAALARCKGGAA